MQTLKDVKREMYENMKNRYNDFLSEEERYIVEHLESVDECLEDWNNTSSEMKQVRYDNDYEKFEKDFLNKNPDSKIIKYTEDKACDIVCQSLDWMWYITDTENACWEAWYIRWYEVALKEILHEIESSNNKLITADKINYLLTN